MPRTQGIKKAACRASVGDAVRLWLWLGLVWSGDNIDKSAKVSSLLHKHRAAVE